MKWLAGMALVLALSPCRGQDRDVNGISFEAAAHRIARALKPSRGERVLLRYDPMTMPQLEAVLRRVLTAEGATVETMTYGPGKDFAALLDRTDIYVWLPAGPGAETPSDQVELLVQWLDAGKGRQVHFHWADGTRGTDGLAGRHSAAYDRVYMDALDIDYARLDKKMEEAISKLRSGEVKVTTAAGTDIAFRVADRPFCKQNGDASRARMATARIRIDREIELPGGALRVAPVEDSVNGTIVVPWARIDGKEATGIRLEFARGVLVRSSAESEGQSLAAYLESGPGLKHFREFALGLNPRLVSPPGERWVAYYGYGAGVVRLGVGDNTELGGQVRGGPVRWLFFTDATVRVGDDVIVDIGRLAF